MESGIRVLLLIVVLAALEGCASVRNWYQRRHAGSNPPATAQSSTPADDQTTEGAPPRVIEPQVERRPVKVPNIHSSNIELGLYYGALSIEDFGVNPVYGVTAAYHVTEDFFFQAEAGRSHGGLTSYEVLSGNAPLLTEV